MKSHKKRTPTAIGALSKNIHKDTTPVVLQTLAQTHQNSNSEFTTGSDRTPGGQTRHHHKVVLHGVDTLTITAGGICSPSPLVLEQYEIWNEYQEQYENNEEYSTIQIGNEWWEIYPYSSRHYKYQFRNNEIGFVKLFNPEKWISGASGKQQVHITFYSKYLHRHNQQDLVSEVNKIISHFVDNIHNVSVQISRLDLHTDITNGSSFLTQEQVDNTISRSRVRQNYYGSNELQLNESEEQFLKNPLSNNKGVSKLPSGLLDKLIKNYYQQDIAGAEHTIRKRELETCYFGKKTSSLWGKFYNKSVEVKQKNDNDTPLLWLDNGYNGEDIVVRVEFSMRRDFLKEIDNGEYVNFENGIKNISKLWDYLTTKWLRMVEKVDSNNSMKSVVTSFWNVVTKSFITPVVGAIRKKNYNAKITQLWSQGLGCIKQMIALGMNDNEDYYFINSVTAGLNEVLSLSYHNSEYEFRRRHLGIA